MQPAKRGKIDIKQKLFSFDSKQYLFQYELVPMLFPPVGETKLEIKNVEKQNEDAEEVANIKRLYEELKKFSTLTEILIISLEHWREFPPRPPTDTYFKKLSQTLVAIGVLLIR